MRDAEAERRFWARVVIKTIPECWDWTGPLTENGYGNCSLFGEVNAHRIAYRLAYAFRGERMDDRFVLHACDRPSCCNPRHLRLGSVLENADDQHLAKWMRSALEAREHGNDVPAWVNSCSTMTADEVAVMRFSFDAGCSVYGIAEAHGVTMSFVDDVVNGRTWRHVA